MTGTEVSIETQAQRIADRGRDALLGRLRSAYGDAAAAHADLISLDDEHIERMVQAAADRADGLQWRRALADVAAEELGVSTREALSHPALARAQALAGAPAYEQSLAELIARPVPPPVQHQAVEIAKTWPSGEAASGEAAPGEFETVEADAVMVELLPAPDPIEDSTEPYDVEAGFAEEQEPGAGSPAVHEPDPEPAVVVVPAIHLGGVANLPTKRDGLSLRLSADGLDILQGEHDIIGRLIWDEIEALEVPHLRARRRAKQLRARLVVRTPHGDASFEVPELASDELRDRVEPLARLYSHS